MEHGKGNMPEKLKRLLQLSTKKCVSNWLTTLSITEYVVLTCQSNTFGTLSL